MDKYYTIHENDAGLEACEVAYVEQLEAKVKRYKKALKMIVAYCKSTSDSKTEIKVKKLLSDISQEALKDTK